MFGKILVCTHLGVSLVLATWAMVLYTTRIDFSSKAATATTPAGELVGRKAEYERQSGQYFRQSDLKWRDFKAQLESHEFWRPVERPWYGKQIEFLRSGADEKTPVRQVDRDANGNATSVVNPPPGGDLLVMGPIKDREGNVYKNRDGQPLVLKSMDFYNKEYDTTIGLVAQATTRLQTAAQRDIDATNELKGTKEKKGLQARIKFEREKQERVLDEYNEVRPLYLKTAVELQNLEQLRTRLEERLKELRSKGDAEK